MAAETMPAKMRRYLEHPPARISPERVAKRKQNGARAYPKGMLDRLCRQQKNKCAYCSQMMRRHEGPLRATIDHVVPVSAGGRTRYGNVVAACSACNTAKGSQTAEEFRAAIADRNPEGGNEVPSRSDESGGSRSEIAQNPRKSVVYGRTA